MPDIVTVIQNELLERRVIPFSRFMELALYYPDLGYYERSEKLIGTRGDFITSVSVGPLFGCLLGLQFIDWLVEMSPEKFQIIECGAHDGSLAQDVLSWIRQFAPEVWSVVEYQIIEPSARRQKWQREKLVHYLDKVSWGFFMDDIPPQTVSGVIFSNEFLDAFPVTRLRWSASERQWKELGIIWQDQSFCWTIMPDDNAQWREVLENAGFQVSPELERVMPDGFLLDVAIGAGSWWKQAAARLNRGRIVTLDYGLSAREILDPIRWSGTLRSYRAHRMVPDPLSMPGAQDLTSEVNFTQVEKAGAAVGLSTELFIEQSQFLVKIGTKMWERGINADELSIRQFRTLTHPEFFGSRFRVLSQKTPTV